MAKKQQDLTQRVMAVLKRQKKEPISLKMLEAQAKVSSKERPAFRELMESMKENGELYQKRYSVVLSANLGLLRCQVVSVLPKFGFVRPLSKDGQPPSDDPKANDIFIPGRMMLGALPGDLVLVKPAPGKTESPEGVIVRILEQAAGEFSGVLQKDEEGRLVVLPDRDLRIGLEVLDGHTGVARPGDKVLARVVKRGESHFAHKVEVVRSYGSAQLAQSCAEAVLEQYHTRREFDPQTLKQAQKLQDGGVPLSELTARMDLTDLPIFTIDGADSKDLDDAVSLDWDGEHWFLGVHIADVSHYVRQDTPVDREAYLRGTSIYYADQVIPMLPKALSNGICSLNPDELRLTFSALVTLDAQGNIVGSRFVKSYIRSRVKGVYSEVNAILDGSASPEVLAKYQGLVPEIEKMHQLSRILRQKRAQRGSMELSSSEAKFVIEDGKIRDIIPRTQGESERIIEEFMLIANEAAATLAMEQELPFVYRVHDKPPVTKAQVLHDLAARLGLDTTELSSQPEPRELANLLQQSQGTPCQQIINNQILRTMAKAAYSDQNIGHFGLVLENYAHFTSPIRRYPDLIIHRILSCYTGGMDRKALLKRFGPYVPQAARHCSEMELAAVGIERDCDDCYKAEYMSSRVGQTFRGTISSVTAFGIYVELPNTVEGLVHARNMPAGEYVLQEGLELADPRSGRKFQIGQEVEVLVLGVDVSAGQVDFALAEAVPGQAEVGALIQKEQTQPAPKSRAPKGRAARPEKDNDGRKAGNWKRSRGATPRSGHRSAPRRQKNAPRPHRKG